MKPTLHVKSITLCIGLSLAFIVQISEAKTDNYSGFRFEEGKYQSSFKFKMAGNLIVLPVTVEGKKLNMIFDTGMNSIIIFNRRSIETWKYLEKHTIKFSGLGAGKRVTGKRLDGLNVKMPNINGKGLSLVVTQFTQFPDKIDGIKIDGVFGYQLLAKFIVQIDYENQLITLTEPDYFVKPLDASELDISVFNTKPYINCPVTINNKSYNLNLLVDTGAATGLMLNSESIGKQNLIGNTELIGIGLSGNLEGKKIHIDRISMGYNATLKSFKAYVPNKRTYPNESDKLMRDGTIGGETLKRFRVTLDYFNNKLYLETNQRSYPINKRMVHNKS